MPNFQEYAAEFVSSSHFIGKIGPLRFEGSKAYSYEVLIARKVNGVMLLNNMAYSTSTSAHRGKIRRWAEAAGMQIIEAPNLYDEHGVNLQHFDAVEKDLRRRLMRATRPKPIEDAIKQIQRTRRLYLTVFPSAAPAEEAA